MSSDRLFCHFRSNLRLPAREANQFYEKFIFFTIPIQIKEMTEKGFWDKFNEKDAFSKARLYKTAEEEAQIKSSAPLI